MDDRRYNELAYRACAQRIISLVATAITEQVPLNHKERHNLLLAVLSNYHITCRNFTISQLHLAGYRIDQSYYPDNGLTVYKYCHSLDKSEISWQRYLIMSARRPQSASLSGINSSAKVDNTVTKAMGQSSFTTKLSNHEFL